MYKQAIVNNLVKIASAETIKNSITYATPGIAAGLVDVALGHMSDAVVAPDPIRTSAIGSAALTGTAGYNLAGDLGIKSKLGKTIAGAVGASVPYIIPRRSSYYDIDGRYTKADLLADAARVVAPAAASMYLGHKYVKGK